MSSIRRKRTSKTSAACKPGVAAVSDDAIPAATLILVRDRPGGRARAAHGRTGGRHGLCRGGAWYFPAGGSTRRIGCSPVGLGSTPRRWRPSARPSRKRLCRPGSPRLPDARIARTSGSRSSRTEPFWRSCSTPWDFGRRSGADALRALGAAGSTRCAASTPCSSSRAARRASGSRGSSRTNAPARRG